MLKGGPFFVFSGIHPFVQYFDGQGMVSSSRKFGFFCGAGFGSVLPRLVSLVTSCFVLASMLFFENKSLVGSASSATVL